MKTWEVGKFDMKLENIKLKSIKLESSPIWRKLFQLNAWLAKLDASHVVGKCCWKDRVVGKLFIEKPKIKLGSMKLESSDRSKKTFDFSILHLRFSNFDRYIPTWPKTFQLQTFQLGLFNKYFGLFNKKLTNYSIFSTTIPNYMRGVWLGQPCI